jgi:ubiquinone/menaquinone biosynthesis C-methylase UbiE
MSEYVLGSAAAEIVRLDRQAASIAGASDALLHAAGIAPGMRVLDLGTGLGHVAYQVAEIVGPTGSVVGVDREAPALAVAESRRSTDNVRFVEADVRTARFDEPFDAIVCRLLLFHLPDAVDVLRHHHANLEPGGIMAALDYDEGSARTQPEVALARQALAWTEAAFRVAGANPRIGARLIPMLREAGFADVTGFGVQAYFPPDDPSGPALLAGIVRTLAPTIVAGGIATEAEIGLDTLEDRLRRELEAADAVLLPPTVTGAWGRLPSS